MKRITDNYHVGKLSNQFYWRDSKTSNSCRQKESYKTEEQSYKTKKQSHKTEEQDLIKKSKDLIGKILDIHP